MFITRGMRLHTRDGTELAGALAREIGHVLAKHALNTTREDALVGPTSAALRRHNWDFARLGSAGTETYARGRDQDDDFAVDRK